VTAPECVYNGTWRIGDERRISVPPLGNWDNGDLGPRRPIRVQISYLTAFRTLKTLRISQF
jgi:hypothetical protein